MTTKRIIAKDIVNTSIHVIVDKDVNNEELNGNAEEVKFGAMKLDDVINAIENGKIPMDRLYRET